MVAEPHEVDVLLDTDAIEECLANSALSNTRLAGKQDELAIAVTCILPATKQKFDLLLAADKRGKLGGACLQTAFYGPRS